MKAELQRSQGNDQQDIAEVGGGVTKRRSSQGLPAGCHVGSSMRYNIWRRNEGSGFAGDVFKSY